MNKTLVIVLALCGAIVSAGWYFLRPPANDELILATERAARLGTIGYEIVCGISARIDRRYTGA